MKAPRLRLGRDRKLHGSRVFAAIRTAGQRRACGCLILNWRRREDDSVPALRASRLGVVTSRRLGGAVIRSRARRMLREAFRLQQHQVVASVDVVLIARPSLVGKPIAVVMRDLQRALRDAGLWNAPTPSANGPGDSAVALAAVAVDGPARDGGTSPTPAKGVPCTDRS